MKRVVTAEEMRRYEQERFTDGRANSLVWMERAAQGVDKLISVRYAGKRILVVCGGGNNGGDGFALLRLLTTRGENCAGVLLADASKLTGDAKTNHLRALELGVLLRPLGNVVYALPPASTTEEQCDRSADAMAALARE